MIGACHCLNMHMTWVLVLLGVYFLHRLTLMLMLHASLVANNQVLLHCRQNGSILILSLKRGLCEILNNFRNNDRSSDISWKQRKILKIPRSITVNLSTID